MDKLTPCRDSLKKFGISMGIALAIISLIVLIKHKQIISFFSISSAIFFTAAFLIPGILKPIYVFWMKLTSIIGWINTRIILFIAFYLVFTPMGLVMRLFGRDSLQRRIELDKESYWIKNEKKIFTPEDYERQF